MKIHRQRHRAGGEGVMVDIILGLVLIAIFGGAIAKIVIEKKKGAKCIGCPSSGSNNCACNSKNKAK